MYIKISFLPSIYSQKSVAVIDAQEGPDVQQLELCLSFCNILYGERMQKEQIHCVYMS